MNARVWAGFTSGRPSKTEQGSRSKPHTKCSGTTSARRGTETEQRGGRRAGRPATTLGAGPSVEHTLQDLMTATGRAERTVRNALTDLGASQPAPGKRRRSVGRFPWLHWHRDARTSTRTPRAAAAHVDRHTGNNAYVPPLPVPDAAPQQSDPVDATSATAAPGAASTTSSTRPWNGSPGSTTVASSKPTARSHRPSSSRTTTVRKAQANRPRPKPNSLHETRSASAVVCGLGLCASGYRTAAEPPALVRAAAGRVGSG